MFQIGERVTAHGSYQTHCCSIGRPSKRQIWNGTMLASRAHWTRGNRKRALSGSINRPFLGAGKRTRHPRHGASDQKLVLTVSQRARMSAPTAFATG